MGTGRESAARPLGGEGCAVGAGGPALTPRGGSQGCGRPRRPLPPPGTSRRLSSELWLQHKLRGQLSHSPRSPAFWGGRWCGSPPPITPILAPAGGSCPICPSGPLSAGSCFEPLPLPSPQALCLKGASVYALEACHLDLQGWTVHSLQGGGGWTGWGRWRGPKAGTAPSSSVTSKASPGAVPSAVSSGAAGLGNATSRANPWAWRCVSCCSAHEVTEENGDPPPRRRAGPSCSQGRAQCCLWGDMS